MDLLFLVLFFCFFLFLYALFELTRDDFVILRKNISMEKIFNVAFIIGIVSLFSARLFFIISHPSSSYFNPLVFLVFPYYPGLSLMGGLAGGLISSYLLLRNWNMPMGRLVDFFVASFVAVFPLGFILSTLTSHKKIGGITFLFLLAYVLLFVFVDKLLLPKTWSGKLKDGSLALISLPAFSLIYIIANTVSSKNIISIENIVSLLLLLASLGFLFQYEGIEKLFRK